MSHAIELEKRSSAVTLSDMELFVFPDLIYSIVLANIMSPRIWRWREDPWFDGVATMKPYRRITRLKQFIMDHYVFNLDLDTWGLTRKSTELDRFRGIINPETITQANALFGYEGDKYYFDIDIRKHFGLDKYEGDVIPYWKTETVEAMDAFRHKEGYGTGAGECVSLSALYAAALFVVARIPLQQIYLMATPLHSQNFVDVDDGVLTNNRRLVTKTMWFNGTAISAQARRALENERVTLVAHESGCIHMVYDTATIDPRVYSSFTGKLRAFLKTSLTSEILGNYLRHSRDIQKCFQLRWPNRGTDYYLPLETAFAYETGSSYLVTGRTREKLLSDVERDEYQPARMPRRIVLNDLEDFVAQNRIGLELESDIGRLKDQFSCDCMDADAAIERLIRFCNIEPELPSEQGKKFVPSGTPLGITADMGREEIVGRLESIRTGNEMVDLAFYAYRDVNRTEAAPFLVAAVQRNPVSIGATRDLSDSELIDRVTRMPDESIYDEAGRLAQPDEVWNYGRGDGVEKALLLANILLHRHAGSAVTIRAGPQDAVLSVGSSTYSFAASKGLNQQTWDLSRFAGVGSGGASGYAAVEGGGR